MYSKSLGTSQQMSGQCVRDKNFNFVSSDDGLLSESPTNLGENPGSFCFERSISAATKLTSVILAPSMLAANSSATTPGSSRSKTVAPGLTPREREAYLDCSIRSFVNGTNFRASVQFLNSDILNLTHYKFFWESYPYYGTNLTSDRDKSPASGRLMAATEIQAGSNITALGRQAVLDTDWHHTSASESLCQTLPFLCTFAPTFVSPSIFQT